MYCRCRFKFTSQKSCIIAHDKKHKNLVKRYKHSKKSSSIVYMIGSGYFKSEADRSHTWQTSETGLTICAHMFLVGVYIAPPPFKVLRLVVTCWSTYRNLGETQKPLTAQCWGPGTWPHPSHCRFFTVCHLDWDGSIVGHLFLCPLGSSYSSRTQHCIVNQTVSSIQRD